MPNLEELLAEAEQVLADAKDKLLVAELHQDQLTEYSKSNTWYARYANEDELKEDAIYVGRKYREALVNKNDAESKVRSLKNEIENKRRRHLAAEAALAEEQEKKRLEEKEKEKKDELKPKRAKGPEYTPD